MLCKHHLSKMNISHSLCNILNCYKFQIGILAQIESFQEHLAELASIKSAGQYHLLKQIVFLNPFLAQFTRWRMIL